MRLNSDAEHISHHQSNLASTQKPPTSRPVVDLLHAPGVPVILAPHTNSSNSRQKAFTHRYRKAGVNVAASDLSVKTR